MDFDKIAIELNELEYKFSETLELAIETNNFEPFAKILERHNELILSIRKYFIDNPVALIPADASKSTRTMIQEILLTGKSPLEAAFEGTAFAELFDYSPDSDDLEKLAQEHFLSWFSHYDYVDAILDTVALVLRANSLPPDIRTFLHEMRQCYAFKQYLATIVLCRTSLELGLLNLFYKNIRRISIEHETLDKKYIEDWIPTFKIMRESISSLKEFQHFNKPLKNLYHELSRYVHGQHHTAQETAKKLMIQTIQILHDLYEVK